MTEMIPAWVNGSLQPVEKMQVHRMGLRHLAVSVFVVRGHEVLIQRRAMTKYHTPGLWANTCCTHPHWGEAPIDCAVRRLAQEVGMTGLRMVPAGQVEYRAAVGGGLTEHEVVEIFIAELEAGVVASPDPGEVAELQWVTLDDLAADCERRPERYTPWLRIYLAEHREMLFGAVAVR